jgi:transketolase
MTEQLPRDVYIDTVYEAAKRDRNIVFITADLGAKGLDNWRADKDLRRQFIHAGISEQSMINLASGLASEGKNVFCYAMASFIAFRPFEQIKVTLASAGLPVTLLSVGVGYGYDSAGPTHYATEDIGIMRSLANIEILSPCDTRSVVDAAKASIQDPKFRYVRLDRQYLPDVYSNSHSNGFITSCPSQGIAELVQGYNVCLLATGFMTHTALRVRELLHGSGIDAGVVDVYRLKSLNAPALSKILKLYPRAVTLEEHFLSAGFGSIVAETMVDNGVQIPLKRIGIHDNYLFENGGRAHLHKLCGIDEESIANKVKDFMVQRRV